MRHHSLGRTGRFVSELCLQQADADARRRQQIAAATLPKRAAA